MKKYLWIALVVVVAVVVIVAVASKKSDNEPEYESTVIHDLQMDEATRFAIDFRITVQETALDLLETFPKESEESRLIHLQNTAKDYGSLLEFEQSSEYYAEFLELNPQSFVVWNSYGSALEDLGNYEGAEEAYMQAIRLNATEEYIRDLAEMWQRNYPEERKQERKELLESGVAVIGQTQYLISELGKWYLEDGDCERAIDHYEVLVNIAKNTDRAKEDLAKVKQECSVK